MARLRHIVRLLAFLTIFPLVSCIDCHEEIWLNADGSGRADISYTLPAAAARFQGGEAGVRRMIEQFLQNTPTIRASGCEVSTVADRLKIRVHGSFDSVLDFKEISKGDSLTNLPSSAGNLAGDFVLKRSGRTFDISRTIAVGSALPGVIFLPSSQFKDRNLTYIVHLPVLPEESNATRIEDGGRTLVWDIPLGQAVKAPFSTRFKAKAPIPVWMSVTAVGGTLGISVLAFLGIRKLRRRRPPERGIHPA